MNSVISERQHLKGLVEGFAGATLCGKSPHGEKSKDFERVKP
jgi:hypothetical protein